jgi:hypothetical protein
MSDHVFIAVVAALVNLILSVLVPCMLKKQDQPMLVQVKKMFDQHREMLITSSVLVGVIVFLSLKAAPTVRSELPEPIVNLMSLGRM